MAVFDVRPRQNALAGFQPRPSVFAAGIEALGNIPNQVQQIQAQRQQQQLAQLKLGQEQRESMPIEQVAPDFYNALKQNNIELKGATFGEAKQVVPLLSGLLKEKEKGNGFIYDPETKSLKPIVSESGTVSDAQARIIAGQNRPSKAKNLTSFESQNIINVEKGLRDASILTSQAQSLLDKLGPLNAQNYSAMVERFSNNPEYSDFKARTDRQFQTYRKMVTGAQASFPELQALQLDFPNVKDPPDVYLQKTASIQGDLENFKSMLQSILESQGKAYPTFKSPEQKKEEPKKKGKFSHIPGVQ